MKEKIKALLSEAEKDFIYAKAKIEVYNSVLELMSEDAPCESFDNIEVSAEPSAEEPSAEPDYINSVCINAIN